MKRWAFFLYGVSCHLLFLATFAYMAAFAGNLLVSKTIDTSTGTPLVAAVAIDLLLIGLFGIQHSVMARPGFKRVWTMLIPNPIERSTYALASCLVTILLMWQWRSIDLIVWNIEAPVFRAAVWGLFAVGWLMVPAVSLLIDHFDLFGTRQVWLYLRGREYTSLPFRVPGVYKHVRHPLYVGWAIAFWATPTMTAGHLLFAVVLTGYMVVATVFEERDLIAHFGHLYEEYRGRVPRLIPSFRVRPELKGTAVQPIPVDDDTASPVTAA